MTTNNQKRAIAGSGAGVMAMVVVAAILGPGQGGCAVSQKTSMPAAEVRTDGDHPGESLEATSKPQPDGELDMKRRDQARTRIDALWREIEESRVGGGMTRRVSLDAARAMSSKPLDDVRAVCERPDELTGTCQDVCRLADSICTNADSICRLSLELSGNEWATGKCNSAKAACAEASERCCGCDV